MTKIIKLSVLASILCTSIVSANQDLGQITVTSATKSEQSIKDITSNVEVITSYELEEKNINSVSEALNLVSGVGFTSNGGMGATTSINLRGMNSNRTLVLIDGVRFQDPSNTSGANIAHLMVSDIKKIEVIKGAQSGIWGAEASAGVINIITKSAKKGTHGSILAEAGSFNTKKLAGTISHKEKNYDIKLSAQKIKSDGFTTKAPRGEDIEKYEDDSYENTTLNLKSNYKINDDAKLNLNIVSIDALKEYDDTSADDITMKSDIDNKLYNLNYIQNYNNHNIKLKIEKSDFKREEVGTVGTNWGAAVKDFNGQHKNIELIDNIKYNKKDFVVLGAGKKSDEVDFVKTDNSTDKKDTTNKYIYATNSNKIDNIILTQSVRYDKFNNFENKTTGKVGIKYIIDKKRYISSNIGTAYNVPSLMDMMNPWGVPRLDLKPEQIKSYDVSYKHNDIKITYFNQNIKDMIVWGTQYTNEDATIKGIELEYKKEIIQDTLFALNYTRLDAKDKDGKDLQRRAKENLKVSVDYYGIDKLHLGLRSEYIGERKDTRYNQDWTTTEVQTGKYTVSNFVANYDIKKDLKVYTKIDNITDKYYQTVDGYATSPRAYYAGVKYSF
ncbi:MAG: TonB-dependent receptor [Campylobacterota bacterium]|nr:TonB-dependent receptor [Campylobacterota bacterium]